MNNKHFFKCILLGNDTVTLECLHLLLRAGHQICWVVTSSAKIQQCLESLDIRYSENLDPLQDFLEENHIDYLFSIINDKVIPENILKKINGLCINYHNSLLPTYAGLHAVPMAILNHESEHGITWHIMTTEVDAGDILKQDFFAVDPDESAHTLYVKCSLAAIQTFKQLIVELEQGTYQRVPQDINLRTFFGKEYHIPDFGFINWHDTADNINTLCRALSFQNKENLLGHVKTIIGHECYLVKSIKILSHVTNIEPGTITCIKDDSIQISTGTEDIEISALYTCEGQLVDIQKLIRYSGLDKNRKLYNISNETKAILQEKFCSINRNKSFWLKEINAINKCFLPLSLSGNIYQFKSRINPEHIDVSGIIKTVPAKDALNVVISSILVILYRLSQYKNISIKITYDNLIKISKKTMILSPYVLLTTELSPSLSFQLAKKNISEKLIKMYEKETFIRDLWLRKSQDILYNDIPLAFIITDHINDSYFTDHHQLYFFISTDGKKIATFCREKNNTQMTIFYKNISHYIANVLKNVILEPDSEINKIPMGSDANLKKVAQQWNATERPSKYEQKTIHAVLKYLSQLHPHRVAVIDDYGYLTYLQLYDKSKLFAQYIRSKGVSSGDFVAIYMDRSLDLFIAIFGILSAGAAYVPIDTGYPKERINYIISDSGAKVIIYKDSVSNKNLFSSDSTSTIDFNSAFEKPINSNGFEIPELDGNNLCYIIYTSGSTGKPKGVMITHKNVLNYSSWFSDVFNFKEDSAIEFSSSIAFDLSISCTIVPIINGGKVIICHEETKADPDNYLNFIKANNVTHIECTPAYMNRMLDYPLLISRLTRLKWLLLGCDTLVKADVEKWMHINPSQKIVNEYGPTECTVAMTQHTMTMRNINAYGNCVPIGKPAHNVKAYILDNYYNVCLPGFLGELYITGESLSPGYWNKPEIQVNKFIVSKFEAHEPYNRLYATGDLAFYHDDGSIEFMGRKDSQVKIRGYRVELQEIEAVILTYPNIKQCTVIAVEEANKSLKLEAYIIAMNGDISFDEIYTYLKNKIPSYMVPRKIYFIDKIPVNFSGKIDRISLEAHKNVSLYKNEENVSETTRALIDIWADILQLKNLQTTDDFFEIGGDSLSVMRLIVKVKETFNVKLLVKDVLQNSILIKLSRVIETRKDNIVDEIYEKNKPIFLLSPDNNREKNIFLIHPIGGGIFWYQELSKKIDDKFSLYAIQDPSFESREILFNSIEEMASFYIKLIKEVQPHGDYVIGGASFGATVAFEIAKQLEATGETVDFTVMFDGWAIYPEQLKDEKTFKKIMKTQRKRLMDKYKNLGLENINELLAIQQHRSMLLQKYQLTPINSKIILFKAKENWGVFESIQSEDNYWRPFCNGSLIIEPSSGNHETMLFKPHVQSLISKLNKYLEEYTTDKTRNNLCL